MSGTINSSCHVPHAGQGSSDSGDTTPSHRIEQATSQALDGDLVESKAEWVRLLAEQDTLSRDSLILNNLAAVEAALGNTDRALELLELILMRETSNAAAQRNRAFLRDRDSSSSSMSDNSDNVVESAGGSGSRQRVALLSLLFNWPSTGGGTVHTKELAEFLALAGYEVQHLYASFAPWNVGQVHEHLPYQARSLAFSNADWNAEGIVQRFQDELAKSSPDWVIVTDSWNSKPLLVEAAAGYRTLIRIAAQECLCPLNNVRLLVDRNGMVQQCQATQFANPQHCRSCVATHGPSLSGGLHQAERELCGYDTAEYSARLTDAFAKAEGVLAVNPQIAEAFRPYARAVHVIPSGFDAGRFKSIAPPPPVTDRPLRLLFAGLTQEFMKGFHVLRRAAALLWQQRQDFEIWATGESESSGSSQHTEPWLKFIGWQSQAELPQVIEACDMLVFPTIAQEALGRTAVEAMACGRPVIASRLGGLSWVVEHDVTGLLCRPGDSADLAAACERLLDDAGLRRRLGESGRKKFEREFTWEAVLSRHYVPLLGPPILVEESLPVKREIDPALKHAATAY